MPREHGAPPVADEGLADVRARLNALSTLGFFTPPGHEAHARARELDKGLLPVRARARMALAGRPTPGQARAALAECWKLVDVAGETIDDAGWLLRPGGTRGWAERHVEHVLGHVRDQPRSVLTVG